MKLETFITRWSAREGGAERANYQMFLSELCDELGVHRPDPAGAERDHNDYVFERAVRPRGSDTTSASKRIDLYKRNAFILEAKQSRLPGKKKALPGQLSLLSSEPEQLGRRSIRRDWDVMMQNARRQAEDYVFLLDADHAAPPFLIVCDVAHCLELYADFTGTGRAYSQFPDRQGFRIYMEDLRKPAIRELLAQVWTDPHALNPTRTSARVTRDIARRLAQVSKALEERRCNPEDVAHFLMRCLFTMFAEDVDLLPADSFRSYARKERRRTRPISPHRLKATLAADGKRARSSAIVIETRVRHFNGGLFQGCDGLRTRVRGDRRTPLAAANHKWTDVDPAIFGTLLEQALDRNERRKLGAHYTPRSYVQRLVEVTVMEPLRGDWQAAADQGRASQGRWQREAGSYRIVRGFHRQAL